MSKVNGELWELGKPLEADCELQLFGFDTAEGKQVTIKSYLFILKTTELNNNK